MNTQQKGAGGGGETQPLPGAQKSAWSQLEGWEGSPDSRLSTKTPLLCTELPEAGVTPSGGGCWNKEGSQQEEMDPISSSLTLFSATVLHGKNDPSDYFLLGLLFFIGLDLS